MERTRQENAVNKVLREIDGMVNSVKADSEVTTGYMHWIETEEDIFDRGKAEGITEGRAEGERKKLTMQVCRKLRKSKSPEEIAEELEEDPELVQMICEAAQAYAPEYDEEKVYDAVYHAANKTV